MWRTFLLAQFKRSFNSITDQSGDIPGRGKTTHQGSPDQALEEIGCGLYNLLAVPDPSAGEPDSHYLGRPL